MQKYLLIALGGALGAILRYVVGVAAAQRLGSRFPGAGTLIINVSACFLIGLVLEYLGRHTGLSAAWRYLVPIGFLGAYSTFSTFEFEAWTDFTRGAYWVGIAYVSASLILGFVAVSAGVATARALS